MSNKVAQTFVSWKCLQVRLEKMHKCTEKTCFGTMTFDTSVDRFVILGVAFNNDMSCIVVLCVRCVVWCNMHRFGRDMLCGADAAHCRSGIHGFRCWPANRGSCQEGVQRNETGQWVCATSVINATASKTYKILQIWQGWLYYAVLRFVDTFVDVVGDFSLVIECLHFLGKMGIIVHHQYCVQHKTFVLCP